LPNWPVALFNLTVAGLGTAVYFGGRMRRRWVAELVLAAALMRLVIYALVVAAALVTGSGLSLGNDEPIAARLYGLPSLTFVLALALPFTWLAVKIVTDTWAGLRSRSANAFARAAIMLCVGIFVGNILDPWLFPRA